MCSSDSCWGSISCPDPFHQLRKTCPFVSVFPGVIEKIRFVSNILSMPALFWITLEEGKEHLLPCSPSVIIQNIGQNEFCHASVWSFFFFRRSYVLHPVYIWWPSYSLKLEIVKKLWVAQWCSSSSYSKPCLRDTHPNLKKNKYRIFFFSFSNFLKENKKTSEEICLGPLICGLGESRQSSCAFVPLLLWDWKFYFFWLFECAWEGSESRGTSFQQAQRGNTGD